ncbi:hypothetical protein GCM10027445_26120 [Amycolatopsis endophytica]|uniref:Catechol 2,3-dioxygenase-like lactoylglutathione lyase family enzyme n=1 Tax=Amycolatopsis endophytica TaxID=860233 RepID=A0A853BC14_9PSEU|nr:VOC family protein [Amycolatopsis endophytica]NYI92294.1 catechol 2,3-dioxygenase-like lactoylglutathione lyase family enzyme [Amycolatopsis endophytica]
MTDHSGLRHVEIGCRDLAASVEFYRDLLGLRPLQRAGGPDERWLDAGPALLRLVRTDGDEGGWRYDDLQRGFRHIGLKVGSVDRQAERIARAGVTFTVEPKQAYGGVRLCFFQDPDGTVLEFVEGHLDYDQTWSPELAERERAAHAARPPEAGPSFDHVAVTVEDTETTIAFYREAFGYPVIGQLRNPRDRRGFEITYLQAGPAVLEVFAFTGADTEPSPWRPGRRVRGINRVAVGGAPAERVAAAGGHVLSGDLVTDRDRVALELVP